MPDKTADAITFYQALARVRDDPNMKRVAGAFNAFTALEEKPVLMSREISLGLRDAANDFGTSAGVSLSQAIAAGRARRFGRDLGRQCLVTPLLVKGLEFNHVAILNAGDLTDAELVYGGLTRACRKVIVISKVPKLFVTKPSW